MRSFFAVLALALALAAPGGAARGQAGYDRPGGDYTSFSVRTGDPAACAARCEREGRCRAWSFAYPTTIKGGATCWLKSQVTPRQENDCCVSGVRGAGVIEPKDPKTEFAIDRTGGDYRSFEVPSDSTGDVCRKACEGENRCRAWTYVRPGYISNAPRCYLKDRIKPPRRKPCCISGVVR